MWIGGHMTYAERSLLDIAAILMYTTRSEGKAVHSARSDFLLPITPHIGGQARNQPGPPVFSTVEAIMAV